jgi:quercetin dioxygenase-like cupin family protein
MPRPEVALGVILASHAGTDAFPLPSFTSAREPPGKEIRMTTPRPIASSLVVTLVAGAAAAFGMAAPAAAADADQVLIEADAFEYAAGPGSIPEGAEYAVLYGNPGEEGLFAMRLRLPDGYHIPPHHHGQPEVVTVISGSFLVGMGEEADREATTKLDPGSFFAFPPGHVHYAYAGEEDTVIQLNSTGPWTLTYADPAEDPRTQ